MEMEYAWNEVQFGMLIAFIELRDKVKPVCSILNT